MKREEKDKKYLPAARMRDLSQLLREKYTNFFESPGLP